MRVLMAVVGLLVAGFAWGAPEEAPAPPPEPPVLLEHGLWDSLPEPDRSIWQWTIVAVGGAGGVTMAFWGLGTALAHLSDPDGPPLDATVTGLAWGTLGLAAAGVALDALLNAP